jgi:hypothetical protein
MGKTGNFFGKIWNDGAGCALVSCFAGHNQTFPLTAPRVSPTRRGRFLLKTRARFRPTGSRTDQTFKLEAGRRLKLSRFFRPARRPGLAAQHRVEAARPWRSGPPLFRSVPPQGWDPWWIWQTPGGSWLDARNTADRSRCSPIQLPTIRHHAAGGESFPGIARKRA